jgi:hypothetical protein
MKKLIAAIALLSLVGCGGINYRETNIKINSGADTTIDASGATNTTGVDQKSAYDLGQAIDAAKGWLDNNVGKVLDSLKAGKDIVIPVTEKVVPDIEEVE